MSERPTVMKSLLCEPLFSPLAATLRQRAMSRACQETLRGLAEATACARRDTGGKASWQKPVFGCSDDFAEHDLFLRAASSSRIKLEYLSTDHRPMAVGHFDGAWIFQTRDQSQAAKPRRYAHTGVPSGVQVSL